MPGPTPILIRDATPDDVTTLIALWGMLFDEPPAERTGWRDNARQWFLMVVGSRRGACFPVVEIDGDIVSSAVGTLELGVPNPFSPRGRAVRLANVITRPEHRGRGYATAVVLHVIDWARTIDADRVDLSATTDGERIYARQGFEHTSAPRMKLML